MKQLTFTHCHTHVIQYCKHSLRIYHYRVYLAGSRKPCIICSKLYISTNMDDLVKFKSAPTVLSYVPGSVRFCCVTITDDRENLIKSTTDVFPGFFLRLLQISSIWPIFPVCPPDDNCLSWQQCFAQGGLCLCSVTIVYVNSIFRLTIIVEFIISDAISHR